MIAERNLKRLKALLFTGFGLMIAGAFLPWTEIGPFSESGIEGDGAITLILAAGGAIVAFTDKRPRGMLIAVSVAVLSLIIAIVNYIDVTDGGVASAGAGLYFTVGGAALATVAAAIVAFSLFRKPAERGAQEPPPTPSRPPSGE